MERPTYQIGEPILTNTYKGIPFYCIDGSKKGDLIFSDFKPTTTSLGEVYHKHTFALRTSLGILFTDIASINKDLRTLTYSEGIPLYLRSELSTTLNIAGPNGTIL